MSTESTSINETANDTIQQIASHYKAILNLIGEDCDREGLKDTPMRAAKALAYLTRGYAQDIDVVINNALFDSPSSEMVVVKDIEFYSLCEHHILPFFGTVSVGYIPGEKIVGLSKIARIVDVYARRLQVQERLAEQICEAIYKHLNARGVIVRCEARHLCMQMRGVQKQSSSTVSFASRGAFNESPELKKQFFQSL